MYKAFAGCQGGLSASSEAYILGQAYRQLFFGHQYFAAVRAINDGNRSAPITLTANQPVAQAVVNAAFTKAFSLSLVHNGSHSSMHFHAGEFAGVNQHAFLFLVGAGHFFQLQLFANRANGNNFIDAIFISKHPVTLVTSGHAHYSASTIIIQYIVGYPNFYLAAGVGVYAVHASVNTLFFAFAGGTLDVALVAYTLAEGFDFFSLGVVFTNLFDQRMLSSQCHKGYAISGIRTSGVHGNLIVQSGDFKGEFQALAAANPVALHGLYALRPAFQQVQVLQQLISIISDFEEPLAQILLHYIVVAAPAFAVDNLLVSEYGVTGVAPVNSRFFLHSQATLVEQLKEPLSPFIIIFLAGSNLAVPVIGQTQSLLLASHISDVFQGPFFRGNAVLDSSVFGGHTKGVPAHGMQHIEALHGAETSHYVTNGIVAHMAHMQIAGRIREHFQHIGFRFVFVDFYLKGFVLFPVFLPFSFNLMGSILFLQHVNTSNINLSASSNAVKL